MIPDSTFKQLPHSCKGYQKYLNGQSLSTGYKPDFVLRKGSNYIILESENCSSRKTFVGGMIKAAHFLQGRRKGKLIFVIVPKENTTAKAIANHLAAYLAWIQGKTNLQEVWVIEAKMYYQNNVLLELDCPRFDRTVIKV